jgi:hypothetical protein
MRGDLDPDHPLDVLVAELRRHHETHGPAVRRGQGPPVDRVGEQDRGVDALLDRQAVDVLAPQGMEGDELAGRPGASTLQDIGEAHPRPAHAVDAPALHAMEVPGLVRSGKRLPGGGIEPHGLFDEAVDGDRPAVQGDDRLVVFDAAHREAGHRGAERPERNLTAPPERFEAEHGEQPRRAGSHEETLARETQASRRVVLLVRIGHGPPLSAARDPLVTRDARSETSLPPSG